EVKKYLVPLSKQILVQENDYVRAGMAMSDGAITPLDILAIKGPTKVQDYIVNEVQEVYRLQGVSINDKHIEIIIRQMLRWVKVEEVGDTEFLVDEQVDKFYFQKENEKVVKKGGKPAKARPLLLGITKSALSTDSFIAAASFQETTRVLTEASLYGKVDRLRRLKENIIMGRLIPAGTGYKYYHDVELKEEEEAGEEIDFQIPS
ncbi:MAG: DNA-directed RNA polymerase subunit beta', partial [Candidatus Aminicenantes bacterium]|nr:DNA-directed RNA polymerase subunit beta' [Candidatus Aminicenantes bacterium]